MAITPGRSRASRHGRPARDVAPPKPMVYHGGVGVGTWTTTSEYKDAEVVAEGGHTVLKSDLTGATPNLANPSRQPGLTLTAL